MLQRLGEFLGDEKELAWKRLKAVSNRREELRLPDVYAKLRFAQLKESQAKKVHTVAGDGFEQCLLSQDDL